jgi:hypothetical protein
MSSPAPAPQPSRPSAAAAAMARGATSGSTSGSGGDPPSDPTAGAFEIGLSNDTRTKTALHALVLVLPLAILIFWQALQDPNLDIELPILKLKLKIRELLPILLLLVSFMLHRAVRYARIVLWNILQAPAQMGKVARIALDDADAYKINSAYYDDVLDPMTVDLNIPLSNLERQWLKIVARFSFATFNVIMSLAIYGIIFVMLVVMCVYVTTELFSLTSQLNLMPLRPLWPIDPVSVIGVLVLGLAGLLLFLAWLNAAVIVLIAVLIIVVIVIFLIFGSIGFAWRTILFAPLRLVLRKLYVIVNDMRERHRVRVFERDMAAYLKRKAAPDEGRVAEYRVRLKLFNAANDLQSRCWKIQPHFGSKVLDRPSHKTEDRSAWKEIRTRYGFTDFFHCSRNLMGLALIAPIRIVENDGWRLHEILNQILDKYDIAPDTVLDALIQLQAGGVDNTDAGALTALITERNSEIVPAGAEIRRLQKKWERKLEKMIRRSSGAKTPFKLSEEAEAYFREPEEKNTAFNEPPPVRGGRDSKVVTLLLNILARMADA